MHGHENSGPQVHGIVAEYDDPDALLAAAKQTHGQGYKDLDAYSPLPIHGLAEAIGFTCNHVALITLIAGLTGAAAGFLLQAIGAGFHYPYDIGGRAHISWQSFIPITFESMVLLASFTCGLGMLAMNGLPQPYHPIMNAKNFHRATSDRFFLCVESTDPMFDAEKTKAFLEGLDPKPLDVSEVVES